MIEYTWDIAQLEVYPEHEELEDVVFTVHWRLSASDGQYTSSGYGSVGVAVDDEVPFTPYEDLTKEQVVGWVVDALNASASEDAPAPVTQLEAALAADIARQKAPVVITPALPWG